MKKLLLFSIALFSSPFLLTAQNVGVDVLAPTQKLDVAGAIRLGSTTTGGAGSLRWNGTNFQVHNGTQWITFGTGTDNDWAVVGNDMYSEPTGNVGIGIALPVAKFQVVGASRLSALNINGNYSFPTVDGGAGFVLSTNGAGVASWVNPALTGDITAVVAGAGLINGGTSGSVTLDVNPGDGIVITSDEVRVRASDLDGNGITVTSNNFDVNVDNSTLDINADVLRVKPDGITSAQIATGAVTTTEILNGTILTSDISVGGVTSNNILDGTIVTADISVGGVTSSNILNGTIVGQDIAPSNTVNQVLTTTVASTTVAWANPATLTTVLQDGDADTKVTVDVANADEDHIRLSTVGAERMTIDNAGEIGIGTNTPDRTLHVTAAAGGVIIVTKSGATAINQVLGEIQFDSEANSGPSAVEASAVIRGIASETHGNSNKGGHLAFATKSGGGTSGGTAASERMRITNAGNVGIGTINPLEKLDVNGYVALEGKEAFRGNDAWLRLNQAGEFTSGTYTPNFFRADGGITSGGAGSPGGGQIRATGLAGTGNRQVYADANGTLTVSTGTTSSPSHSGVTTASVHDITFNNGGTQVNNTLTSNVVMDGPGQIMVVANLTATAETVSYFQGTTGGSGSAGFRVELQRQINAGGWTVVQRANAMCGFQVSDQDYISNTGGQGAGGTNAAGLEGDRFSYPSTVALTYVDVVGVAATYRYRLVFITTGTNKNGGIYRIYDRSVSTIPFR